MTLESEPQRFLHYMVKEKVMSLPNDCVYLVLDREQSSHAMFAQIYDIFSEHIFWGRQI